jgi:hypothetical protein
MNAVIGSLAALLYLLAGGWTDAAAGARQWRGKFGPKAARCPGLGSGAAARHGFGSDRVSAGGLNLGFFNALSFTAWLINAMLLAVGDGAPG